MKSTSLRRNSEFYPSPLVLHSESHDWIAAHRLWWLSDSLIPKQTRLTTPFNSIITQQNINRYNLIRAESVIYQRRSPLQELFSATNWAGLVGTKLTNQNAHRQRRMVTFLVNEPMTSKNANNRSTAMYETNKLVANLRTGMFSCFRNKKIKNTNTKWCPTYQKMYLHSTFNVFIHVDIIGVWLTLEPGEYLVRFSAVLGVRMTLN